MHMCSLKIRLKLKSKIKIYYSTLVILPNSNLNIFYSPPLTALSLSLPHSRSPTFNLRISVCAFCIIFYESDSNIECRDLMNLLLSRPSTSFLSSDTDKFKCICSCFAPSQSQEREKKKSLPIRFLKTELIAYR